MHTVVLKSGSLALLLVATLMLAGCAGGPGATPDPLISGTAAAVPPTPAAVEPTGFAAPPAVFDGDCAKVIADDALEAIAGAPVHATVYPDGDEDGVKDAESTIFRQVGAISCVWDSAAGGIYLTILRGSVAPSTANDTCDSYSWGEASMNKTLCVVDVTVDGIRVSGSVNGPSRSKSRAIAERLVSYLEHADLGAAAGAEPVESADSWQRLSCTAASTLEIDGKPVKLTLDIPGSDAGSLQFEDELAESYSAAGCYGSFIGADGREGRIGLTAMPDGAWQFDEVLAGIIADGYSFTPVDVAGFDHGFLAQDDRTRAYYLVSGSNYLTISVSGQADDVDIITQIVAILEKSS